MAVDTKHTEMGTSIDNPGFQLLPATFNALSMRTPEPEPKRENHD